MRGRAQGGGGEELCYQVRGSTYPMDPPVIGEAAVRVVGMRMGMGKGMRMGVGRIPPRRTATWGGPMGVVPRAVRASM